MKKILFALIVFILMVLLFMEPPDSKRVFAADDIGNDNSPSQTGFDLTTLSIEELMNIEVVTAGKRIQKTGQRA